uniref:Uncharacterized protein n=1 Tax=Cyprinus carpio TaxID=7962 RepID=A0A8C1V7Y6_CYPCA
MHLKLVCKHKAQWCVAPPEAAPENCSRLTPSSPAVCVYRWNMATRVLQSSCSGLYQAKHGHFTAVIRGLSASNNRNREDSWFKSLFVRKVDPRKDAHSHLLAKKEDNNLYKIQFHNVKPECLEAYNTLCAEVLPSIHRDSGYPCELVGTWNTWYGEQDQAGKKVKSTILVMEVSEMCRKLPYICTHTHTHTHRHTDTHTDTDTYIATHTHSRTHTHAHTHTHTHTDTHIDTHTHTDTHTDTDTYIDTHTHRRTHTHAHTQTHTHTDTHIDTHRPRHTETQTHTHTHTHTHRHTQTHTHRHTHRHT